MYFDLRALCILAVCAGAATARDWAWPEGHESVRIDTKVRFLDDGHNDKSVSTTFDINKRGEVQSDDVPFRPPTATAGFYNRPPGSGQYPVRVVSGTDHASRRAVGPPFYPVQAHNDRRNDGTVDSILYCKCVSTLDCTPRQDSAEVCGNGKYLCCYNKPNKSQPQNSEYFNEIHDERPALLPSKEKFSGAFPSAEQGGYFAGPQPVLAGPDGPSGIVGPPQTPVLSGPDGPTGQIGPLNSKLEHSASAQRGILIGPGGYSGMIGPINQRPVLVGPRGPTGMIGPNGVGSRGVLVGPGGPTGIIGPGYGRQTGPGLLVGPGGPTGSIGPGRRLLVGPGGPTGRIGPLTYFGN